MKDIFHPSAIVSGMWAFLLLLYKVCDHPLWNLSDKFFLALNLWVIPFVFCCLIVSKQKWHFECSKKCRPFNLKRYNHYFPVALIYSIVFVLAFALYGGSFSIVDTKSVISKENIPLTITLLLYLNTLMTVYVFYGVLNHEKVGMTKVWIIFLFLLFMSVFKGNKTSFLSVFIGLFFILKNKGQLRVKYIWGGVTALTVLLIWISVGRSDYNWEKDSAVMDFLYIYFLSPLPSFDMILHHEWNLNPGSPMSATFSFFYKIFNVFGANYEIAELGDWVSVPLPNNVFTTLRPFYIDGGFVWITVMACVLGTIGGILYTLQKQGNVVFTVFYATMVSSLFFQSFDDYFFRDLSIVIQYYFFSVFMVRGFKMSISR